MDREWHENQPIYRQLRDRVVAMILDVILKDGDALPSVRTVAAEYRGSSARVDRQRSQFSVGLLRPIHRYHIHGSLGRLSFTQRSRNVRR